jgi:hypothetical protein
VGAAAVLVTAVVALRHTQPPGAPLPGAPTPTLSGQTVVARFAASGVLLPEPGGPPAPPATVLAFRTGPQRVRVAWGPALPGGAAPPNAVGYEVRWTAAATGASSTRLVAAPEIELDRVQLPVQVRSVDAFGRRSAPTVATTPVAAEMDVDPQRFTGLAEPFDGPFSVDTSVVGARWHLSGYPGCTTASVDRGMLAVDLDCGADVVVLRARSPMRLEPGTAGAGRGRVALVTDAAGPTAALTIDLVPGGAADRVGTGLGAGLGTGLGASPRPGSPPNGTAVVDPALPDGALRVLIDDGGARVLTGAGVPRLPPVLLVPPPAPARGVGVLHVFELAIDGSGLQVLQDGAPIAVANVAAPWTEANVLIGISGPPGRQARVRLDAVGFTGPSQPAPPSYAHPVVPATQRVLGTHEEAPGIGISRQQLASAVSARLVAIVAVVPGVDLRGLVLQHGDATIPAHPVLSSMPSMPGTAVTVAADLPPDLLGPGGPPAVSPLVLRAPGADTATVAVIGSYLEIVPQPGVDVPPQPTAGVRASRQPPPTALPRPSVRLLDTESHEVSTPAAGTRLVVEVSLDGVGGQLDGTELAGVAGFQLWMDNRQVAGLPTANDGPGIAGVYRIALSTRSLNRGAHFVELRLIGVDPALKPVSVLASWQLS